MRLKIGIVLAILLVTASFCSKDHTEPPKKDPLTILLATPPSTLDPQIPFEVDSSYVLGNIFDTLVEFDGVFRLQPGLAKRWTSPDDKTWRFYLNQDAYFSNGTPLTASDVAFSIQRPKTLQNSDLRAFTEHITETKILDQHTIDIKTDIPFSILANLVFIPIVSEKEVKAHPESVAEHPLGSGPYKLASRDGDRKITLALNEYYKPKPAVHQIDFVISSDLEKILDDVLRLKPDLTVALPFRKIEEFQKKSPPELELLSSNGITVEYLIFNLQPNANGVEKNPLTDNRLRRALAHAIDKKEIVKTILKGFGRPATQLIAPEIFGYAPGINPPEYNLEEAKRLIREGGYEGLEIPIHSLAGGSFRFENYLIQAWNKIGIKVTLKIWKDLNEMNQALNDGNFQMALGGYVCTSGDAGELLSFGLHTRTENGNYGKGNYAHYSNPVIDQITEENQRILDAKTRLEMLQSAMKTINEDLPYLPLLISDDVYVVSKRIRWTPPSTGELRVRNISYR